MKRAIYIGDEFPDYYGWTCDVEHDEENDTYCIRFDGETDWTDNIFEDELEFI